MIKTKLALVPFLILSIVSCFSLTFCSSSENQQSVKSQKENLTKYELIANEKFRSNYNLELNKSKTYVLCYSKPTSSSKTLNSPISFFVFDLQNDTILFEESLTYGSVSWLNDFQIEVKNIPGIVKGKEDDTNNHSTSLYIFDVKQKKKIFDSDVNEQDL